MNGCLPKRKAREKEGAGFSDFFSVYFYQKIRSTPREINWVIFNVKNRFSRKYIILFYEVIREEVRNPLCEGIFQKKSNKCYTIAIDPSLKCESLFERRNILPRLTFEFWKEEKNLEKVICL